MRLIDNKPVDYWHHWWASPRFHAAILLAFAPTPIAAPSPLRCSDFLPIPSPAIGSVARRPNVPVWCSPAEPATGPLPISRSTTGHGEKHSPTLCSSCFQTLSSYWFANTMILSVVNERVRVFDHQDVCQSDSFSSPLNQWSIKRTFDKNTWMPVRV